MLAVEFKPGQVTGWAAQDAITAAPSHEPPSPFVVVQRQPRDSRHDQLMEQPVHNEDQTQQASRCAKHR